MRIVKLFKENTTFLTSVIVAFALGMGFAYVLSAYFLAWEYSPEAVETLSALGVFLTPIVALWIFTRWRQQRHSQIIMDHVISAKGALVDYRFEVGNYANVVLSHKKRMVDEKRVQLSSTIQELNRIRGQAEDALYRRYSDASSDICKVLDIQSLQHRGSDFIDIEFDELSASLVLDKVEEYVESFDSGEKIFLKEAITDVIRSLSASFDRVNDDLELIYKKG